MNDTNLVSLHLENNEYNYNYVMQEGERLLMLDNFDLKVVLRNECIFQNEQIDWDKVDADVLREDIANLQRGE